MLMMQIMICLTLFMGVLLPLSAKAVGFGGEVYFSPQFGGTDFNATDGSVDHKKSWNFFYNMGLSLGVKGCLRTDIFAIGLSTDLGWKEEAVEHRSAAGVSEYDYQMLRGYAGGYFTFGKVVYFYAGYDPIVYAKMTYTDNEHVNPFRKNDVLKGYAYSGGVGFEFPGSVGFLRFLGRTTIYNNVEFNGVERELPDSAYSKINTGELVVQFGSQF